MGQSYQVFFLLSAILIALAMADEQRSAVVSGNNHLVNQLYKEIAPPNENIVFSPLSLHTVLALVYQGSGGNTAQQFKQVLRVPDQAATAKGYASVMSDLNTVPNVTLEVANRVFVKSGFSMKQAFVDVATKQFAAGAENIDFVQPNAAETMNTWVKTKTKGKISELIQQSDLSEDTRMVLINAVYFKGDWADKFDKERTRPDKFYISETETVPCDMMARSGKYRYKNDGDLGAQVLELPYKSRAMSLLVVLPHSKTGIGKLEEKMAATDLSSLTANMYTTEVDVSLPKFKIESKIELNEPLQKIGLTDAFSHAADFSGLLEGQEPLQISKVIQKAFIEVNEEGAEAAAATGVMAVRKTAIIPMNKADFRADHPFIFMLSFNHEVLIFQACIKSL